MTPHVIRISFFMPWWLERSKAQGTVQHQDFPLSGKEKVQPLIGFLWFNL